MWALLSARSERRDAQDAGVGPRRLVDRDEQVEGAVERGDPETLATARTRQQRQVAETAGVWRVRWYGLPRTCRRGRPLEARAGRGVPREHVHLVPRAV